GVGGADLGRVRWGGGASVRGDAGHRIRVRCRPDRNLIDSGRGRAIADGGRIRETRSGIAADRCRTICGGLRTGAERTGEKCRRLRVDAHRRGLLAAGGSATTYGGGGAIRGYALVADRN